jgi:hypothetical protein
MRRIDRPDLDTAAAAVPWTGLPDDLWERGRSARIGRRFVGDVAGVLADILAADARTAADAAVTAVNGERFVAAREALRFLSARVDELEARLDPLRLEAAEWPQPRPDPSEWAHVVGGWIDPPGPPSTVVVGDVGDGTLFDALAGSGRRVVGVEPRGPSAWRALGRSTDAGGPPVDIVFDELSRHLGALADRSADGVVLMGCADRADLAAKVRLLAEAVRVTRSGGTVVVLALDQEEWDEALSPTARDLAPGRPLHPTTWSWLLERHGVPGAVWHRPESGTLHAVVARVDR